MSGCSRLARQRGRIGAALSRPAQVGKLLRDCRTTWRIHLEGPGGPARIEVRSPSYGDKKLFRGTVRRIKSSPGLASDVQALAKLPLPRANVDLTGQLARLDPEPGLQNVSCGVDLVATEDFPILCRRLRRLPLRQLAVAVSPAFSAALTRRMPPEQAGSASARLWAAVSRRVVVNSAQLPLSSLAFALPRLQSLGHLAKVSALSKVVRGLARQAQSSLLPRQEAEDALAPLLRCCKVLQLQLAVSKPRAAQLFAGRLHQALARRLPVVLEKAPAALVLPWLEYYAEHGLVDHGNVAVWEHAGKALQASFMSDDEEARLFQIQERIPLWVSECLPMVSRPSSAIVPFAPALEVEEELTGALESVPDAGDASLASARPPSMSPPMYQKSPPVPVLWHISPENFQRRVSRLDTRQLVLALRYAAADGAGLLAGGSSRDPAAQRALTSATGQLPRRHRSRSRAQQFVGALLEELVERAPSLRPAQACSAVKSIASLKALAGAPLASSVLEALASGPLAGWKIATTLRPCDVALLLQGWSQLVEEEGEGSGSEALTEAARHLLRHGAAPRLLALSSCALQEAGAPPPTLGSMCAGAAQLAIWQRSEGNGSLNAEMHRRLRQFLVAAAQAARDGPFLQPPGLRLPLSVLRAAGDAGMWNSEAFSMLAPMVTVLILGPAVKTRPPHHLRDWVPRLPRPGFVRSAWRPEELAEAAFLFAKSSLPLEGNVAAALSLTLLVHVSVLKEALRAGESQHRPTLEEVDRRVLCFAEHSVEILRRAAREPLFEPWRPPKKGPGFEPTPSVERFEPEVLEDERMCVQIVSRWRKLSHATSDQGRQGARRRSAEIVEVNEALDEERLLRSSLLATAALAVFRGLGGAAGASSRSELLQTLTLRLAPSGSPARCIDSRARAVCPHDNWSHGVCYATVRHNQHPELR